MYSNYFHTPFYIIPIVEGYDIEIDNSKQTCDDEYRITEKENSNESKCKALCDAQSECNFFYINVGNWCVLYSSCTEKRTAGKLGTTYKKTIGTYNKNLMEI